MMFPSQIPATLERLWSLAFDGEADAREDWNTFFDPVGLILHWPPANFGYWCTPIGSMTFANTGGDGVHYGLLESDSTFSEQSPVVMTVPMCDTPNMILGENLIDFLALGCRTGFFSLENLIYKPDEMLECLASGRYEEGALASEIKLLKLLEKEFQLKPWSDPRSHLNDLESRYASQITITGLDG